MKERLIRNVYSKKTIKRIEKKYELMGIEKKGNAYNFLFNRILLTITIFIIALTIFKSGYLLAPILSIFFYFSSEYLYLDKIIENRASKLDYEALFYFQVLALSLESGKDLRGALLLTSSNIDSTVSREFKKTVEETNYGKSLSEALSDMKKRIPSEAINSVIVNITQSNIYGNNIIESLNNQIEFIRNKKILEVKGAINKMPLKISIISVLFIIPIVLLILLGPLLIKLVEYIWLNK